LLTLAPRADAWGCRGHQAVAALAEKHLTPQAKQALLALLTANPIDPQLKRYCGQMGLDPFVDSSTWADDERGRDPSTAPWHFIDIPIGVTHGSAQTIDFLLLSFQQLLSCFFRNSFVFTSICVAPWYFRAWVLGSSPVTRHESQVTLFHGFAASCSLLPLFFRLPSFVFNRLQPLCPK